MIRFSLLSVFAVAVVLSGCNQTKTILGFNRNVNDEFSVLTTPPLSLPENFDHLPSPVAKSSNSDNTSKNKARDAAMSQFSTSVVHETNSEASVAEVALLQSAGDKDPEIRAKLEKESKAETAKNKSAIKDMLNIKDESAGKALDPFEEKKRLEEQ